jgi:Zn-dependent M28 family amino/carboxypeptidase
VAGERLRRIRAQLALASERTPGTTPLCEVSADIVGVSGAGIMLMAGNIPQGSFCASNPVSDLVEELQFTLGEGPCVDAYQQDRPVLEADLADPTERRWFASPLRPSTQGCAPSSASRSTWARSVSARSTCTATDRDRCPTTSTQTRS